MDDGHVLPVIPGADELNSGQIGREMEVYIRLLDQCLRPGKVAMVDTDIMQLICRSVIREYRAMVSLFHE